MVCPCSKFIEQKPGEEVRGLTADPVRKTYWVYTDQSLFELVVGNEDRDVWKVYLERERFDAALKYTKVGAPFFLVFVDIVLF